MCRCLGESVVVEAGGAGGFAGGGDAAALGGERAELGAQLIIQ